MSNNKFEFEVFTLIFCEGSILLLYDFKKILKKMEKEDKNDHRSMKLK